MVGVHRCGGCPRRATALWPVRSPRHQRRKSHCAFLFGCIPDSATLEPNVKLASVLLLYAAH